MLSNGFPIIDSLMNLWGFAWPGMTLIPKVRTVSTKKGTFYTDA